MKYIGYICNCQGIYYFLSKRIISALFYFFTIVILAVYMILPGMQNALVHIANSLLLSSLAKERITISHFQTNYKRALKKNLRDYREDSFYGISRVQSLGKALASRTFVNSKSLYTTLSNPIPKPPCGGQPYRNVFK